MSQAGNALLRGVDAEAVVADLDRLRAAHVVAEQWLLAVENRLAGPALYLLEDELPEQAETNREAGGCWPTGWPSSTGPSQVTPRGSWS